VGHTRVDIVIILENFEQSHSMLRMSVEKLGFSVLAGENGLMGLEFVARCQKENLNLVAILADISMPKMDGFTFLKNLNTIKKGAPNVPFFFLANDSDKKSVVQARNLGATGYILKPLTLEKIYSKFQEHFPSRNFPVFKSVS
jgi:two-component system chemotaxis response regulator CheY